MVLERVLEIGCLEPVAKLVRAAFALKGDPKSPVVRHRPRLYRGAQLDRRRDLDQDRRMTMIDATEQARQVREGEASPVELVNEAISKIEELNPTLNAVIHPLFDEAREAAADELPDGPFRGVPFLVKDLSCYMAGLPVHEGMRVLR